METSSQARNVMGEMRIGNKVLFYRSGTKILVRPCSHISISSVLQSAFAISQHWLHRSGQDFALFGRVEILKSFVICGKCALFNGQVL